MNASSFQQEGYDEFRWTIVAVAALAGCAVTLAAAIVVSATGDRFEYKPAASALSRYDDELVRSFEALEAAEAAKQDSPARAADAPKRRRTVVRLKSPWCTGVLRHQPFRSCRPRPR